jgi:four helix bundle protein
VPQSPYEELDAFKACHELTLAVHPIVEALDEKDPELSVQLWSAALIASSRIARGSGFRNRRMFWAAADRSLGALSEIAYHLNMADGLSLISKEDHQRLESLRGRAVFYTFKLVLELAGGGDKG